LRVLLTGKSGQVGSALSKTLAPLGDVIAWDRTQLDLADADAIRAAVRAAKPRVIVNAAAYTAVDKAETEEGVAMKINRDGPRTLAEEAAKGGALLVHFSTDYVFDGEKRGPYTEHDVPRPLNAYGRSKLGGEQAILSSACRKLILRTSWVYGPIGNNFPLTIVKAARERRELRVVDDQVGAPTSTGMLARALPEMIKRALDDASLDGLYHLSAAGEVSWYGFALAILEGKGIKAAVKPVRSDEYEARALRPHNSLLDNAKVRQKFGIRLPPWDEGLAELL
jgi:dTDP-4-dehydrorhamnose reductase